MSKSSLLSNLSWKFAERILAQAVTMVVSIILARILNPSDYGIISIVMIFITIANVFVSDGFGSALIQKKNADALDFSSVLYFNIALSIMLYLALFFVAPYISMFYGEGYEILTPVLRVLGLRVILCAINTVQQAYVAKKMIFKKFFYATLFGTVLSAFVGITLAFMGFGVWALVAQYMTNTVVDTLFLAFSLKKKPIFFFSLTRVKGLIGYGWKILATNLLIVGQEELKALIIGKVYSSSDLAYYDKGRQFPMLIITNINTSIGAVLFPKMSNDQDNIDRLKNTAKNSIRFSAYVMCPLMIGLAAVSETFISLLLTEKWLSCVPLMKMFCVAYLLYPLHSANMQAVKAVGRSDILFKVEIVKKILELFILLSVVWISVEAVVMSIMLQNILFIFINAYPNKKLINYGIKEQVIDVSGPILMSIVMMIVVSFVGKIDMGLLPLLIVQVLCGGVVYWFLSVITHNKEFNYIKNIVMTKFVNQEGGET